MIEEVELTTDDAVEENAAADTPGGPEDSSAADLNPAADDTSAPPADSGAPQESVDELEDRVRDLQGAMEKIQSGDLDGAERAIEALEQRIGSTRE